MILMKRRTIITFLIFETILYVVFTAMDMLSCSVPTIGLKYTGILICVLFSVLCAFHGGEKIIPFALMFTAIADIFLLVINAYYTVGILFFLVVQTIYLIYLFRNTGKLWVPVRIACGLLVVAILFMTGLMNLQNLTAGIYFSMLLVNMTISWTIMGKKHRLYAAGLSLFVLCDICVGLYNLYWILPGGLYAFIRIGMWLFYLPSQVFISLSMVTRKENI